MTRTFVILALALLATLAVAQMSALAKVTHLQGCLHSAADGYALTTSDSGTVYKLSGKHDLLAHNADHSVEISGELLGGGSRVSDTLLFRVATVSALNDSCSASRSIADSEAGVSDPKTQAQASQGLPLVGLLGLGSLVAGFLVRR